MKSRSFFSALILAVVTLLLIGGWGAYGLASISPVGAKASLAGMPPSSIFISQRSPIVTAFFGSPDRLISGGLAVTPPLKRRAMQTELKQFQRRLLEGTHLNYGRDIQPWAGDVTWAMTATDWDRDRENGQQPGYLVAIATDQPEPAKESLEKFWQRRVGKGAKLAFENYLGVPIVSDSKAWASAMVGDRFVLFANHPKVLHDALNNAQASDLNLSNSKVYQRVTEKLPADALGFTVINLPQLSQGLGEPIPLNPEYDRLVITTERRPQGLLADVTLLATSGKTVGGTTGTTSQPLLSATDALKFIPENAAVTAIGMNAQQALMQFEQGWGYGTIAKKFYQPIADLEQQWGVNLAKDVLSWMPGEYVLSQIPRAAAQTSPGSDGASDWVFVTRQSPETTAGLAQLNEIAKKQGISIGVFPLGETQITAWTKLQTTPKGRSDLMTIEAKVEGVYATVNGYEVFATSLEALEQVIQAEKNPVIDQKKRSIAALEAKNTGYLFVDRLALRSWANRLPQGMAQKAQLLLEPVTSATLSHYGSNADGQRNGVFIQLDP
jgi:Protein of unknown function (DUF3352)